MLGAQKQLWFDTNLGQDARMDGANIGQDADKQWQNGPLRGWCATVRPRHALRACGEAATRPMCRGTCRGTRYARVGTRYLHVQSFQMISDQLHVFRSPQALRTSGSLPRGTLSTISIIHEFLQAAVARYEGYGDSKIPPVRPKWVEIDAMKQSI